jgi:hypothetical protein
MYYFVPSTAACGGEVPACHAVGLAKAGVRCSDFRKESVLFVFVIVIVIVIEFPSSARSPKWCRFVDGASE